MPLLQVNHLSVEFQTDGLSQPAVSGISFHLDRGEILALVGESGCGKSISCLALARLLPPRAEIVSGTIELETAEGKKDILSLSPKELRKIRGGEIAYIFQEPSVCLNPVFRVGDQIAEAVELHCPDIESPQDEAVSLLRQAGIPEPETRVRLYPHELSGGMQQRVMIAMALASRPSILVADEPTTALDVTIQAQILELISSLRKERNMAVILVTHNLGIVAELADRVDVMYAGRIVEEGTAHKLINDPRHPYTKALLEAVPVLGEKGKRLRTIPGIVPAPCDYPPGCRFCDRCGLAAGLPSGGFEQCRSEIPPWRMVAPGHFCACRLAEEGERKRCP